MDDFQIAWKLAGEWETAAKAAEARVKELEELLRISRTDREYWQERNAEKEAENERLRETLMDAESARAYRVAHALLAEQELEQP